MTKFLPPLLATVCVLAFSSNAHAALLTIGCNTNDYGAEGVTCAVDQCVDTGDFGSVPGNQFISFTPDFAFVDPQWKSGYFFIVDSSYNPLNPTVGIKDVIVIADTAAGPGADPANGGQINVYTSAYTGMQDGRYEDFTAVVNAVLDGTFQLFDGLLNLVSVGNGQQGDGTAVDPLSANRVGYFIDSASPISIALASFDPLNAGLDTLVFRSELACCNTTTTEVPVPEPATLTLVGIGGAVAAFRRRRKTV
jgi:hypothetical protein